MREHPNGNTISAISPGSELLVYRGLCPDDLPLDETIPSLKVRTGFPTKYGYSVVGRVMSCGEDAPPEWEGRVVLFFHPHESHFLADPEELHPLPPRCRRAGADTSLDPAESGAIKALAGDGFPKIYPASPGPDGGWRNA